MKTYVIVDRNNETSKLINNPNIDFTKLLKKYGFDVNKARTDLATKGYSTSLNEQYTIEAI